MPVTFLYRFCKLLLAGVVLALAACSTTGNQFSTSGLRFLVPGETTLAEAVDLLQAEPVNVYRQVDGAAMARWSHTASLVNDGLWVNQELWLAFDPAGRFVRIVKSNNIPLVNIYRDGRRVDLPQNAPPAPAVSSNPISQSAVSYPLNR